MTEEEIVKAYDEMLQMFGDYLPNAEREPKRFKWYVKLYKYYKAQQ